MTKPSLELITPPSEEPLSLEEVKAYLRINDDTDDNILEGLLIAARNVAEHYMRISLITQEWKISFDKYAPGRVTLPMGPIREITQVNYVSRSGGEALIAPGGYYLTAGNRSLVFDATPIGHRVEIFYMAGYGDSGEYVPQPLKYGILSHIAAMYDGNGDEIIPPMARELYMPYRELRV